MTAFVHCPSKGEPKQVKNLGWLLRNWKLIKRIELRPCDDPHTPCWMDAYTSDERWFSCSWSDEDVCWHWLDRPVFRTLPLLWFGMETTCGGVRP